MCLHAFQQPGVQFAFLCEADVERDGRNSWTYWRFGVVTWTFQQSGQWNSGLHSAVELVLTNLPSTNYYLQINTHRLHRVRELWLFLGTPKRVNLALMQKHWFCCEWREVVISSDTGPHFHYCSLTPPLLRGLCICPSGGGSTSTL